MNRRKLLKSVFSLIALLPFMHWGKKRKPIVFGVDKASPEADQTIFIVRTDETGRNEILPLDEYAKRMGYESWPYHANCRCAFEFKKNNE